MSLCSQQESWSVALSPGPQDGWIERDRSRAAGLLGFSPFWDLKKNMVQSQVLREREAGGK